ncbi:hypothetical protein D1007_30582 [Hordeum vulgare]|nr:hypothetical protein D1007_30582 [Hordeum vulgare]
MAPALSAAGTSRFVTPGCSPWRLEAHSKQVDLVHHVRLCLDGLPLHAWDEFVVAQAIGPECSIDYIKTASKLKTDMEVLGVWAWTAVTLSTRAGVSPSSSVVAGWSIG